MGHAAYGGSPILIDPLNVENGYIFEFIKATALQEKTNASLRDKKSPYRIGEIAISASIPPGVSFVIGRIDEGEVLSGTAVTSAELIDTIPDLSETVIALDGSTGDMTAGPGA